MWWWSGPVTGGLTAALCSYEMGTRDVLVVEKSDLYGGTSSISGGGVWIPCNRYARAAGAEDSIDRARTYLRQLITEEEVPEYQLQAFLENGPKMVDFLHRRTRVRYVTLAPAGQIPQASCHGLCRRGAAAGLAAGPGHSPVAQHRDDPGGRRGRHRVGC